MQLYDNCLTPTFRNITFPQAIIKVGFHLVPSEATFLNTSEFISSMNTNLFKTLVICLFTFIFIFYLTFFIPQLVNSRSFSFYYCYYFLLVIRLNYYRVAIHTYTDSIQYVVQKLKWGKSTVTLQYYGTGRNNRWHMDVTTTIDNILYDTTLAISYPAILPIQMRNVMIYIHTTTIAFRSLLDNVTLNE